MDLKTAYEDIATLLQGIESKHTRATFQQFSDQELTSSQGAILLLLDKKGPLKISDIANELNMVNSNVSNICSRLEKAGLVERNRSQTDQRVVKINITATAKQKMPAVKKSVKKLSQKVQQTISEQDILDIYNGLVKLDSLLDALLEG